MNAELRGAQIVVPRDDRPERLAAALQLQPRQAFFLLVVVLHAAVLALLLMPHRRERLTVLVPSIEAQIINDVQPHTEAPPLPPLSLERPHIDLIVPDETISVPAPDAPTAVPQAPAAPRVAAAPAKPAPGPVEPVTPPRFDAAYLKNPPPAYPMSSRRMREQGTVLMRVRVSQRGSTVEVLLEHTSGSERLDQAAMDAVRNWRFVPARRGSEAVEAWVLVPVEFALQH